MMRMQKTLNAIIAFLFCALSVAGGAAHAQSALGFGPYIQILSEDSVAVCAWLDREVPAYIQLESQGRAPGSHELKGFQPGCATVSGLSTHESYAFRLFIDGEEIGDRQHPPVFVITPAAKQTIAIIGDTRSGDNSFDLEHRQIVQTIFNEIYPDAVIHTGDFVERDELQLWRGFFLLEREMLASTPIYPTVGRSDQPAEIMHRLFPALPEKSYYSFDRGAAHFAVLNLWRTSSQPDSEVGEDGEQARWLRKDLAEARNRGSRYIFAVIHEPPFDLDGGTPRAMRKVFMPVLESSGVTAVFSGAHYFSHKIRNGVHYFTNGGGGAELETRTPDPDVFLLYRPTHHFLTIEIGIGGAVIRAVDSQGNPFYEVNLDETAAKKTEAPDGIMTSAATVVSFAGGDADAAMSIFFDPAETDDKDLLSIMPEIATRSGITLHVTFRPLTDAGNRAAFDSLSPHSGKAPLALAGGERFYGLEEIKAGAGSAALKEAQKPARKNIEGEPAYLWAAVIVAILFIGLTLRLGFVKRRHKP